MKLQTNNINFEAAVDYARNIWKTGCVPFNQAMKTASSHYKVSAEELVRYMLDSAQTKLKE